MESEKQMEKFKDHYLHEIRHKASSVHPLIKTRYSQFGRTSTDSEHSSEEKVCIQFMVDNDTIFAMNVTFNYIEMQGDASYNPINQGKMVGNHQHNVHFSFFDGKAIDESLANLKNMLRQSYHPRISVPTSQTAQ